MNGDLIKLLADLGGMGVALAMIIAGYRLASIIAPKFMDMVSNHFEANSAALQSLKDSIDELVTYLKKNNRS